MDSVDASWARQLFNELAAKALPQSAEDSMIAVLKDRCMMTRHEISDFMETVKFGLNEPGTDLKGLLREALPAKMNAGFKTSVVAQLLPLAMKPEPSIGAPVTAPIHSAKPVTQPFKP